MSKIQKNTYLALTIGPIVKTLLNTRKTRELWGASYIFSRIMRGVICRLLQKNAINTDNILLPSPHLFHWQKCPPEWKLPHDLDKVKYLGAGLFPDRLYVKLENSQKENVMENAKEAANEILEELSGIIDTVLKDDSKEYVMQYFQLYFIQKDLPEGDNIIYQLSPLLDTLELQSNFPSEEKKKYLVEFLRKINYSDKLINEAFSDRFRRAHQALKQPERFGFDTLA